MLWQRKSFYHIFIEFVWKCVFPVFNLAGKKVLARVILKVKKKLLSKENIISKTRDPPINEMQIHL
jgi:hypothetical protein